jgi:hypothetical protein
MYITMVHAGPKTRPGVVVGYVRIVTRPYPWGVAMEKKTKKAKKITLRRLDKVETTGLSGPSGN